MKENKAKFVKKFCKLIRENTSEYADVDDITYLDDGSNENIYVTYRSGAQRKINVNADSCSAIMDDFLSRVGSADWVLPSEKIEPSPANLNFFEELDATYSPEDFTGYIGELLDDEYAEVRNQLPHGVIEFLTKLYLVATNYL